MNDNFEDIEKLFRQKMSEHTLSASDNVWLAIEKKLKFKTFFRFSPHTFNVYYSIIIAAIMTVSSYAAVEKIMIYKKAQTLKTKMHSVQPIITPPVTIDTIDTTISLKNEELLNPQDEKKTPIKINPSIHKATTSPKIEKHLLQDDSITKVDTTTKTNVLQPKNQINDSSKLVRKVIKKIIKKKVIVKPSTVIVHDTVVKNIK